MSRYSQRVYFLIHHPTTVYCTMTVQKFQQQLGACYKLDWLDWVLWYQSFASEGRYSHAVVSSDGVIALPPPSTLSHSLIFIACLSPSPPSSVSPSIHPSPSLPWVASAWYHQSLSPLSLSESCISKSWFSSLLRSHTASFTSHTHNVGMLTK